jgi:hypothetical protein
MAATDWPYDTDRDDPLTKLRIPVACWNPQWNYIVAFDEESTERPTDAEAAMLASFLREYIDRWYGERWKAKLAERPFDIDGGANGMVFRKHATDDWAYRRRTWDRGPLFVPQPPTISDRRLGPLSLVELMDHIHSFGDGEPAPRWMEWKAAHPEVFPAPMAAPATAPEGGLS